MLVNRENMDRRIALTIYEAFCESDLDLKRLREEMHYYDKHIMNFNALAAGGDYERPEIEEMKQISIDIRKELDELYTHRNILRRAAQRLKEYYPDTVLKHLEIDAWI